MGDISISEMISGPFDILLILVLATTDESYYICFYDYVLWDI